MYNDWCDAVRPAAAAGDGREEPPSVRMAVKHASTFHREKLRNTYFPKQGEFHTLGRQFLRYPWTSIHSTEQRNLSSVSLSPQQYCRIMKTEGQQHIYPRKERDYPTSVLPEQRGSHSSAGAAGLGRGQAPSNSGTSLLGGGEMPLKAFLPVMWSDTFRPASRRMRRAWRP